MSLPVAVMLGFLGALLLVFHKLEVRLNETARSKEFISTVGSLSKIYYDLGVQVVLLDYTKSPATKLRVRQLGDSLASQFQKLEELAQSDPVELEHIKRVEKLAQQINHRIAIYERYIKDKDSAPVLNFANLYSEFQSLGNEFTNEMHNLTAYESAKNLGNLTTEAQARNILKSWIICGVILNVLMGVLLAIVFNRITSRRLGLLTDNTMRLAANAPLNAPLSGNDELAQLDRFFHSMAAALAAAARKERAIIDNAVDVICSIDDRGHFTAVNPACQAAWGYSQDELNGQSYFAILHPDDAALFSKNLAESKTDAKTRVIETRILNKAKNCIFSRWSLRWSNSEHSTFCVAHDISDKKEMERIKEEFLAMVSHDLRTPLTSLEALLTLLLEGNYGQLTDHGKQRLAGAELDIERLVKLINNLLDIEMLESGHVNLTLQRIDMQTVIDRSIAAVRGFVDQKKINLEVKALHVSVLGDLDRLVQVCVNFLSNAIKFSDEKGSIFVQANLSGDFVEVQVIDKGPGLPLGDQAIIFERYKRVEGVRDEKAQGTGLGLAICKTIVKQHGGEIGVESEAGNGSTFWFRIPAISQSIDSPEGDVTAKDKRVSV